MSDNLPARLKRARKARGYTSAVWLAEAAGVSTSSITNIESGTRTGHKTLVTLAETLRVPLPWLLRGEGDEPDWHRIDSTENLPADAMSIARRFDAIRGPGRAALFAALQSMISIAAAGSARPDVSGAARPE